MGGPERSPMISCAVLERPGKWRAAGVTLIFLCALAPALPLLGTAMQGAGAGDWLGSGFGPSLARSLKVAGAVMLVSLLSGLPCGVLAGLYRIPMRRFLLVLLLLPLLAPSFLWSIGISAARRELGLGDDSVLAGFSGNVLAFQATAFPLVFFATLAATRGLSAGQVGAARLAGGERCLFRMAARNVFGVALLAALLAGGVSLSDPGPGQILGYQGAASQILISFSAQYDFALAARQSITLAGLVLIAVIPVAAFAAPGLARGLLARDVEPPAPLVNRRIAAGALALLSVIALMLVGLPIAGLVLPVTEEFRLERAWREIERTAGNTVIYGSLAAGIAVTLGVVTAVCAGRQRRMLAMVMAGLVAVFALPPALGALGLVYAGSQAPGMLEPLLRSRLAVGLWLGLRWFPVAAIFLMRRLGDASPSWALAAAVHGMPAPVFAVRILLPWLAPAIVVSALVVALFAIADVGSTLLLHPPGEASLPLAIFTVMANAPESLVSSLCLAYLGGAALVLCLAASITRKRSAP